MAHSLKLLSSMAMREALAELVTRFERSSGRSVARDAAGGVEVAKRVQASEALDVVVLSSSAIDKLIAEGHALAGSRRDLVRSGVAVAVRTGAAKPDVSDEAAVRRAVLAARTVGYSTGPSGVYLEKLFERWGILAAIRERIVVAPPGIPVGSLIASGEAELGFQQLSELIGVAGVEVLGSLPESIQTMTVFSGGISSRSTQAALARELLEFLASPINADVKRRYGMEPA